MSFSNAAFQGWWSWSDGSVSAMAAIRWRVKSSWIGIGFSDHKRPIVVEHGDPLFGGHEVRPVGGDRRQIPLDHRPRWGVVPGIDVECMHHVVAPRWPACIFSIDLIDGEAGRLLARRERLERVQELPHDRRAGKKKSRSISQS